MGHCLKTKTRIAMDSSLKQTTLKNDNNHLGCASAIITDSYQYGYIIYLNFKMSYISIES